MTYGEKILNLTIEYGQAIGSIPKTLGLDTEMRDPSVIAEEYEAELKYMLSLNPSS